VTPTAPPEDAPAATSPKAGWRAWGLSRRREVADRAAASRVIGDAVMSLPEIAAAEVVAVYVDARTEVRTQLLIAGLWRLGKTIAVPYCVGDELALFRYTDPSELAVGAFGIREPLPELRADADRAVPAAAVGAFVIPGVAFDRQGGRLGHGKGYYDRLLARARPTAPRIGLAFDGQLADRLPAEPHDRPMDVIVTPTATLRFARPVV